MKRRTLLKMAGISALVPTLEQAIGQPLRMSERMPALFIGHGSPMNAIESNVYTQSWQSTASSFAKPKAILAISAHWQTGGGSYVTSAAKPDMIYDMYGFPDELYQVKYPAPGLPRFADLLNQHSEGTFESTVDWGLDHGTWSVLVHMYPQADVPVVQLSLNNDLTAQQHFELAKSLAFLRDRGVLVLGSGNVVHNLRLLRPGAAAFDWATEFDSWIAQQVSDGDFQSVIDFAQLGTLAQLAHPSHEHLLPIFYLLGITQPEETRRWFSEGIEKGSLGMRSLFIG